MYVYYKILPTILWNITDPYFLLNTLINMHLVKCQVPIYTHYMFAQ